MLIAIEGCLGVGKTTVTRGLAAHRGSTPLLEDFEANPFLRAFYSDQSRNATETEFAFLLLHFHQLKNHGQVGNVAEVIADFHLGKDLIYADLNLTDATAKRLFRDLYLFCLEKTPQPALMVCLSATTDLLMERVRTRDRDFEQDIHREYYAAVNDAYEDYFARYSGRKLRLSMHEWDFVRDPELYNRLSTVVDAELNIK